MNTNPRPLEPTEAPGLGNDMDWAAIRARFPATKHWTCLGIASTAILSNAAKEAAEEVVRAHWTGDNIDKTLKPKLGEVRARFAKLINASADEIAVTKNVTEGLNSVAHAIDWQPGDNLVLCLDLEHPNNIYLWLALGKRGVELRIVPSKNDAIDAEAMVDAIDEHTRIVTVSTITFTPGFRCDLAVIGEAARAAGALFLVDGVQSCGVIDTDVERYKIDALATSTSKGLLGLAGLGFLYVAEPWIERMEPAYLGRFGIKRGEGHYSEFEGHDYELSPNTQRFEGGNYNWSGVAAVHASLAELLAVGPARIEERVVELAGLLATGLAALGLPVTVPPDGTRRSHIVTIGTLGAGDTETTNDPRLDRMARALVEGGVRFTIRKGLLRFGLHYYNDETDIERVLEIVKPIA